jgi:monoamine oxidase
MNKTNYRRAAADFERLGAVSSLDYLFDVGESNPNTQPDNLFDFIGLVDHPETFVFAGPAAGKEVAIIGAGNAGVAAAYLLMRLGLKPVVYDITGRVGGRSYTKPFSKDPKALIELGSMRIPLAQKLIFHLLDQWGIKYKPFQNPLFVDTVVDVNGQQVFYDAKKMKFTSGPGSLIAAIANVKRKYNDIINPIVNAWDAAAGDLQKRKLLWESYVVAYNNKSLYQTLFEHGWSTNEINLFGNIGIGSGGFDSFFPSSFLEIVRIEIQKLEAFGTQQLIVGGTNQIPLHLWSEVVDCAHWGRTSVEKLNDGKPRPGIAAIKTSPDGKGPVRITDVHGQTADYGAVILTASPRAIDTTLNINGDAFSTTIWTALRNVEITSSEKTFMLTKTAFWKKKDTKYNFYTTLTDQPPRQMYTFDSSDWGDENATKSGAICLSYSWADSSIRYNALNDEQRVRLGLDAIENMAFYGPGLRSKIEKEMTEVLSICWEDQYGYSGGWRMANPGQAEDVYAMHAQCLGQPPKWNNGLYLAGEALSWYGLSGWIDGAIKTGLQAAITATRRMLAQPTSAASRR